MLSALFYVSHSKILLQLQREFVSLEFEPGPKLEAGCDSVLTVSALPFSKL